MAAVSSYRPAGDSDRDDDWSDDDTIVFDDKPKKYTAPPPAPVPTVTSKVGFKNDRWSKPKMPSGKQSLPLDDFRNCVTIGNITVIKDCIEKGVPVDEVLRSGWTALMYAGSMANVELMEYLLDQGANANFHANHYSVLMATTASTRPYPEKILKCVELLAAHDVNANVFDRHHMTALMYAARLGQTAVVEKLIAMGVNMDKQDSKGYTALTWAACRGHLLVAQALLEAGADLTKRTIDGSTAADVAFLQDHERVHKLLQLRAAGKSSEEVVEAAIRASNSLPQALHAGNAPNNIQTVSEMDRLAQVVTTHKVHTYGDLELFLTGLELSSLIPVCQNEQVSFQAFLRMTDKDLQQLGVSQLGVRKKILDAIHATHKKDWETSSVASVQYNKQFKCIEIVSMISNINKHACYIASTVGCIGDQLKAHPDILRESQEGGTALDLMKKTSEASISVHNLYDEITHLHGYLSKITGEENFELPDLIQTSPKRSSMKRRRWRRLAAGSGLVLIASLTAVLWKDHLIRSIKVHWN